MATKTAPAAQPEATDAREEGPDAPLLDTLGAELKKLVQKGKERGYVTYDELNAALSLSRALDWPGRLAPVRECLEPAAEAAAQGIAGLRTAADAPQPIVAAYRALRNYAKAAEAIYPMTAFLKPVSQFFLEASARGDPALIDRLDAADPASINVGVMHVGGPPGTRGAFSLYVPEHYDAATTYPLVVAMHGGSGNGGAFLWS